MQEVARYVHHLPLYTAPSIEYTANIYAPLFFRVSSWIALLTGPSFVSMRLVSTLSTVGLLVVMALMVWLELPKGSEGRLLSVVFSTGLFLSLYPICQAFFDLGRVDMLCLFLAGCALLAGRRGMPVVAGLLWVLSFQTKQGMLPVAILSLCFEWQRPRRVLFGLATFTAVGGASVAWLAHTQPFWYLRLVYQTAGGFPIIPRQVTGLLSVDLFAPLGIAILIVLVAAVLKPPCWRSRTSSFYAFSFLGMVLFSCFLRAHGGASINAMIPAWIWITVVAGVAFGRLYQSFRAQSSVPAQGLLVAAACIQLISHLYNPGTYVPSSTETEAREAFLEQVRAIPGEVLIFENPQYDVLTGKKPHAAGVVLETILQSSYPVDAATVKSDIQKAVESHSFAAIVSDSPEGSELATEWMPSDLLSYYPVRIAAKGSEVHSFTPQPSFIYMPCKSSTMPDPGVVLRGSLIDSSRCTQNVKDQ